MTWRTWRRSLAALVGTALVAVALVPAASARAQFWDAPGWGWSPTANGTEYSSPRGTFTVAGPIDSVHRAHGGGTGSLGYPVAARNSQTTQHGYQTFERGVIYSSPAGTFAVRGGVDGAHRARGGGSGALGYPRTAEVREAASHSYQAFERGVLYSGPSGTWATLSSSSITSMHRAAGGGRGTHGYPIGDEVQFLPGQWLQPFERGYAFVETNQGRIPETCPAECYAVPSNGSYWLPRTWEASEIVRLTNAERTANGLASLRENPVKSALATRWSGKMAATDLLWHNPQFAASGGVMSENVLYTSVRRGASYDAAGGAASAVRSWMGSSGHRANILRAGPTEIGVGWIVRPSPRIGGGDHRTDIAWATQVFGY
ncbi:CAP domain-containing protein [Litorihabitans aurantiacus]|uniref:SCP domain-containing protein n=1 Tax=Litorihabitans aurantiacus TaxID=1930061 RepID=A0AA37XD92_9MICO|nr:CAP domain-containing protein [Litorihabitans aurantiacus]GMA30628.1 hypothetical protein GCM10025875_06200 [Litorihabitans aurantiacus]